MSLILEDGTGKADAEAYESVANTDAYWAVRILEPEFAIWTAGTSTTPKKEAALRQGSEWLDMVFGSSTKGRRKTETQALMHPRSGMRDMDRYDISENAVHISVRRALMEIAPRIIAAFDSGESIIPDLEDNGAGIGAESLQAGPLSISTTYIGAALGQKIFAKVAAILAPVLEPGERVLRG